MSRGSNTLVVYALIDLLRIPFFSTRFFSRAGLGRSYDSIPKENKETRPSERDYKILDFIEEYA